MTGLFFKADKLHNTQTTSGMLSLEFLIASIGTVFLFSATWYFAGTIFDDPFRIWRRQLIWVLLGTLAALMIYRMPTHSIKKSIPVLVCFSLGLNLLTYIPGIGYHSGGASRWIDIFGLTFQPSELTRIVLILYLARMMEKNSERLNDFNDALLPSLFMVAVLVASVYFQNDFSTSAYLLALAFMLYFIAGVSKRVISLSFLLGVAASAMMLVTRPYRLERLRSWFRPQADPSGTGYQLIQARTALERGGFWGKGLGQGLMKQGGLPAAHSDFIVAVVGEEAGLVGITLIVVLYTLFALKGWNIAFRTETLFARLGIFGLVTSIYWQALVNFAVVSGTLPATGIPLPLFSAGGSAAFMTLVSFGLIFNLATEGKK